MLNPHIKKGLTVLISNQQLHGRIKKYMKWKFKETISMVSLSTIRISD